MIALIIISSSISLIFFIVFGIDRIYVIVMLSRILSSQHRLLLIHFPQTVEYVVSDVDEGAVDPRAYVHITLKVLFFKFGSLQSGL